MSSTDRFQTAIPSAPSEARAALWQDVRTRKAVGASGTAPATALESNVAVIAALADAPPRTLHSASIVKSSPLSTSVRAMLEARAFGRRHDALELDLEPIADRLPGLSCPAGNVAFLADDSSLAALSLSVDALLTHRRRLVAPSIERTRPRRHVFVLGAGPGGLMAAIELRMRDHLVVVCEQREVYTRNRFIGVYKGVAHLMAALGMPERMTYDFSHYRGKRGIMLADIQTFLHAVALKLGVVIYTGAVARDLGPAALQAGEVALARSDRGGAASPAHSIGITRWHHDTVARVRSGATIRFDTLVEATGGRSGLRELAVGRDNVVSLRELGRAAAARDPSLRSFFNDPDDHCTEFVESDYGCPPELFDDFARAVASDAPDAGIPDELPCFVSNIDASIFSEPIRGSGKVAGVAARIGEVELDIPPNWVVVECPRVDQTLTRYQIEGPLPQSFEFGGDRLRTCDHLDRFDPVSLLFRVLYAMGVPFEAVDRKKLIDFYSIESSRADASDVVATWLGRFRGLRVGGTEPIVWGTLAGGGASIEYGIVGEALQNAWYRFGVGVDDTFASAARFAEGLELPSGERHALARRLERVMLARSVQVLYHLYAVARERDEGVVGPVLTEYYLAERHGDALAEARLREEARRGAEIVAAEADAGASDPLLAGALAHHREASWHRVLALLGSLSYDAGLLARAGRGEAGGRGALRDALSDAHRALLEPLLDGAGAAGASAAGDERLCEIALGRYAWATPWVRACALRALDPSAAADVLARAASDPDPLVAETAAARRAPHGSDRYLIIDKVALLREVSIFSAVPHEILAGVAGLLGERWAAPGEAVFHEGDLGDCLYVIASGSVRVHQGERTLRRLGPRQFFGELALLDAAPRSASVTALERTRLFRVDQTDFYALVADQPNIVHGINRALCQMLRRGPQA